MTSKDVKDLERQWVPGGTGGLPPAIAPYSLGTRVGQLVFTAGQAALDESGKVVGTGDIRAQTMKTLENIGATLERLGASFKDVVKATIWLKDFRHYAGMNEVYGSFFPEPAPPRACVKADLVYPDLLVEIEVIAVIGSGTNIGIE